MRDDDRARPESHEFFVRPPLAARTTLPEPAAARARAEEPPGPHEKRSAEERRPRMRTLGELIEDLGLAEEI